MIAGLLREGIAAPDRIIASGPRVNRGEMLTERYGIAASTDNVTAVRDAEIVVLAVKPQTLPKVLEKLHNAPKEDALILSIVAGATVEQIATGLDRPAVVRAMPNTPARIGEGMTVWTAAETVTEEQHDLARGILKAMGKEIYMEEESYLDKATALSGSGPAYVYLFMEAMVDAGVHLGFPRRIAEELVIETLRGSVNYYDVDDEHRHLSRLRNRVTSPGGTSAEALYYLEKAGFRTAISRAIWAAYERSISLSAGSSERAKTPK